MNRIDRLFAILLLLQRAPVLRAIDLAEKFNVSQRTIYRDINALLEIGVPVDTIPGEGYRLLETFRLPPVMLSPEEATALFLAGRMLMYTGEGSLILHAETALEKIAAVLPPETRSQVLQLAQVIEFFPTQKGLNLTEPYLIEIISAIDTHHTIYIKYRAYRDTYESARELDPYHLTFADGAWYINGYCHLRQDIRSFRLNRIIALQITDKTFQPRIIVPEKQPVITIKVRFNDTTLPHVRERQHYAFIAEMPDNIIVYQVQALNEIQNWIFGFGADAEVISPESLRHWLQKEAERLINLLT